MLLITEELLSVYVESESLADALTIGSDLIYNYQVSNCLGKSLKEKSFWYDEMGKVNLK